MLQQHLPPQDITSEASCIAAALLSRDALLKVLEILQPEDFYLEQHRLVFEAITELDRKNRPVDLVSVKQFLTDRAAFDRIGGDPFLVSLYQTVSTSANAEFYAMRIRELSIRRKLIDVSASIVEKCTDMSRETSEVLDEASQAVFTVTERMTAGESNDIRKIVEDTKQVLEKLFTTRKPVTGVGNGKNEVEQNTTHHHQQALPCRFGTKLPWLGWLSHLLFIHRFVYHSRYFHIATKREPSYTVFGFAVFRFEFKQGKPWVEEKVKLLYSYFEYPGEKKMPELMYYDQYR